MDKNCLTCRYRNESIIMYPCRICIDRHNYPKWEEREHPSLNDNTKPDDKPSVNYV